MPVRDRGGGSTQGNGDILEASSDYKRSGGDRAGHIREVRGILYFSDVQGKGGLLIRGTGRIDADCHQRAGAANPIAVNDPDIDASRCRVIAREYRIRQ